MVIRLDPMICTTRKSESLTIWTTIAPKVGDRLRTGHLTKIWVDNFS
jgi:hypothetical protein